MSMTTSKAGPDRQVLKDAPSSADQFQGRGHERTAESLADAISGSSSDDFAVGLDGPWGSGKSTVVEIANQKLGERSKISGTTFHFFTFDIWQSQGSSFRRSFLERFIAWCRENFPGNDRELGVIERRIRGKERNVTTESRNVLDAWGIFVIATLPFLPIYYFWAKHQFDQSVEDQENYLTTYSFLLLMGFVSATFVWSFCRAWKSFKWSSLSESRKNIPIYLERLSQTLLISSKHFEEQKVTQFIREVDPNDFEFQSTLREILSVVQSRRSRVVMVLDNIDRLPPDEIGAYWAQVRAVFSHGSLIGRPEPDGAITAIVPYDRHLIDKSAVDDVGSSESVGSPAKGVSTATKISSLRSREIFAKTFQQVLTVAPPVLSNSRDFFLRKAAEALPGRSQEDSIFRSYLIFNRMLREEGRAATPREIIAFINEMSGIYALHKGSFGLTTVALYICYRDQLEARPSILTEPNWLDAKLRSLASDANIERNLAAIVFNVDADLAFQILLDNQIRDAAVGGSAALVELSSSPGFDDRVNDVMEDRLDEWLSAGEFEIVVPNVVALWREHKGQSRELYARSLVRAFLRVRSISLEPESYERLLQVMEMVRDDELDGVVERALAAGFSAFGETEGDIKGGAQWARFVLHLLETLPEGTSFEVIERHMPHDPLLLDPHFLFGVAEEVIDSHLPLTAFTDGGHVTDISALVQVAKDTPARSLPVFQQFFDADVVKRSDWAIVGTSLTETINEMDSDKADDAASLIALLASIVSYQTSDQRKALDLKEIFSNEDLYASLKPSSETTIDALAGSIFLAIQTFGADGVPAQSRRQPNGARRQWTSEEFEWFNDIFRGTVDLDHDVYLRVAELSIRAGVVHKIVDAGKANRGNEFLKRTTMHAYSAEPLPWSGFSFVLSRYEYLSYCLEGALPDFLRQYQVRIETDDIQNVKIEDVPADLVKQTAIFSTGTWASLHEKIDDLLNEIDPREWVAHLTAADHHSSILLAKISSTGYKSSSPEFRDAYKELVLGVLNGNIELADETLPLDRVCEAIDVNQHPAMFREIRENLTRVTERTLSIASRSFPKIVAMLLVGDRFSATEKDNVIRFILAPALEAGDRDVLASFEAMERRKVRDFRKAAEETSRAKLDSAYKVFAERTDDRSYVRRIGELFNDKRKVVSLLDIWFPSKSDEDED